MLCEWIHQIYGRRGKTRKTIGNIFIGLGVLVYIILGFIGLIIDLKIISTVAGFWGVVIAFVLFPFVWVAAPFYALVEWNNPLPLILTYGGLIPVAILFGMGYFIRGKN